MVEIQGRQWLADHGLKINPYPYFRRRLPSAVIGLLLPNAE